MTKRERSIHFSRFPCEHDSCESRFVGTSFAPGMPAIGGYPPRQTDMKKTSDATGAVSHCHRPFLFRRSVNDGLAAWRERSNASRAAKSDSLPLRAATSRKSTKCCTARSYFFGCFVAMSDSTSAQCCSIRAATESKCFSRVSAVVRASCAKHTLTCMNAWRKTLPT